MGALGEIPAAVSEYLIGPFYYSTLSCRWPAPDHSRGLHASYAAASETYYNVGELMYCCLRR